MDRESFSHLHRSFLHIQQEIYQGKPQVLKAKLHKLLFFADGKYPFLTVLERAAKLLLRMGTSVKNTAASCGFNDSFYFSRVFKEYTGSSPSRYAVK